MSKRNIMKKIIEKCILNLFYIIETIALMKNNLINENFETSFFSNFLQVGFSGQWFIEAIDELQDVRGRLFLCFYSWEMISNEIVTFKHMRKRFLKSARYLEPAVNRQPGYRRGARRAVVFIKMGLTKNMWKNKY